MIHRLKSIPKTSLLEGKRVLITGVGFREAKHVFRDIITREETHDSIFLNNQAMKINIGSGIAFVIAANGATIHLVSRSEDKLAILKENIVNILDIPKERVEYSAVNLFDKKAVHSFVQQQLPKDKPLFWAHSIGLGAGDYQIKGDNPYLHIENIPIELLENESLAVLRGTHLLMQELLPQFKKQNKKFKTETRIAIVTSMSAIRGYNRGGTHTAAKGAISRYTNSAMIDLWKDKIYITDVRPGDIDTGMYDNKTVQAAILDIVKEYGQSKLTMAPPVSIGYVVNTIFTIPAHIPSVNLVAKGQHPHEGS